MKKLIPRKRHTLRKDLIQDLYLRLQAEIGESTPDFRPCRVEVIETDGDLRLFLVDGEPLLMEMEGYIFPTLRGLISWQIEARKVVVDSGAVRFVANGADIMRPGVVSVTDDVRGGSPVQVTEERHGKPLAVGTALGGADEIRAMTAGKAVRTVHFVGDPSGTWNSDAIPPPYPTRGLHRRGLAGRGQIYLNNRPSTVFPWLNCSITSSARNSR